jgi:hypothetical protein
LLQSLGILALRTRGEAVRAVAFSPDGCFLAAASKSPLTQVFRGRKKVTEERFDLEVRETATRAVFTAKQAPPPSRHRPALGLRVGKDDGVISSLLSVDRPVLCSWDG